MKKSLIPEKQFTKDFEPIISFYAYHVKNKIIKIPLNDLSILGLSLNVKKLNEIASIDMNTLQPNVIFFSSSSKKKNVKNLMWYIRCLSHHPENVEIIVLNGVEYYKFHCTKKNNKTKIITYTMKGLVECNVWKSFINGLIAKIKENENN